MSLTAFAEVSGLSVLHASSFCGYDQRCSGSVDLQRYTDVFKNLAHPFLPGLPVLPPEHSPLYAPEQADRLSFNHLLT